MGLIGILLAALPFILFLFIFHWVNVIKVNSDEQIAQNKKIIELLESIDLKLKP